MLHRKCGRNTIQSQQWWGTHLRLLGLQHEQGLEHVQINLMNYTTTQLKIVNYTPERVQSRIYSYVLWISCTSNFPYNNHITIHSYYTVTEEIRQKKYADMTTGETTPINPLQVCHTVCLCRVTAMVKYLQPTSLKEWWDLEHSCIKYRSQTTQSWGSCSRDLNIHQSK